ncbi:MAG: hypothetical protein ACJAWL_003615 [Motiliproteus sp.]|jgi:hypothetical protein
MNTTEQGIPPVCRSWSAGSQNAFYVAKAGYQAVITDLPGGLRGSERSNPDRIAMKQSSYMLAAFRLTGRYDSLILIARLQPKIRTSTPAVSYMSFSTTPAR